MKRYLLFTGGDYYPLGGWEDFMASFDTLEEAVAGGTTHMMAEGGGAWAHIVDSESWSIVKSGSCSQAIKAQEAKLVEWM